MTVNRTLRDAVYGLAVGDALGVPCEFRWRGEFHIDGMVGGGAHNKPAGTFSDDTSMTLATCDSLRVKRGCIDIEDMRNRFRAWHGKGKYTSDGITFDIGNTTSCALLEGRGMYGINDNGNGSLMRIAPLAFVESITDEQIEEVSAITHAHDISKRGCVMYVRLAQRLLRGESIKDAISQLPNDSPYERLRTIASLPLDEIESSGYIVHTFEAAVWALANTSSYSECVLALANMGRDADTVAAVGGALGGIVYGYDAIPKEWLDTLRGKDVIETCLSSSTKDSIMSKHSKIVFKNKNF